MNNTAVKNNAEARNKYNVSILAIADYLIKYSSESKLVSINDIVLYFTACNEAAKAKNKNDFHDLTDNEIKKAVEEMDKKALQYIINNQVFINVRTQVKRMLKEYIGKDILPGVTIFSVEYNNNSKKRKTTKDILPSDVEMFYIKMPFDETQINLLRDAISVFPYVDNSVTNEIIDGLNSLTPEYNRTANSQELIHAEKYKGDFFDNLKEIRKAFSTISYTEEAQKQKDLMKESSIARYKGQKRKKIKKISFEYYEYNENKELVLKKLRNNAERVVNPIKIMWANGYYYLVTIGYSKTHQKLYYVNYRIDRMKNVKCLEEDAEYFESKLPAIIRRALEAKRNGTVDKHRKEIQELARRIDNRGFAVSSYRYANPIMHTGNIESEIKLRCEKHLMNNIIDFFGFDILTKLDKKTGKVNVTLYNTAPAGVKLFALQYGDGVEILSPKSLRESVAQTVSNMNSIYNS